ncbi:MAG: desulfoferrodoxin FeS4 iron-binding domain-containing protein [Clostridiales bacterium]|nr:desulfoferrodoxin FeS4 iron-binding domain-containing protein [Clostridiales bacterium]
MSVERKFFRCNVCGNLVGLILEGGGELVCCEQPMELLTANTVDASAEKHVPVGKREGGRLSVQVGSEPHPMVAKHYIQWIAVSQADRLQIAFLHPEEDPVAVFDVMEGPALVYEYCNLHGLWKAEL